MSAWIESLNSQSADWADWLWRITWQSALVIAVAFALTLLLRRYSPRLRSWIWRLAYLKLLVLMVWTTPVQLAVLPSAEPLSGRANGPPMETKSEVENRESLVATNDPKTATANRAEPQPDATDHLPLSETNATPAAPINESPAASPPVAEVATPQPAAAITAAIAAKTTAATIAQPSKPSASFSWKSYLLLTWIAGIVLVIAWLGWEIARAARLRRSVRILNQPDLQTLLADVCQHLGLRSSVKIGESDLVGGPMLVRFIRPTIVFPAGLLPSPSPRPSPIKGEGEETAADARLAPSDLRPPTSDLATTLTSDEIRLILAHELAHLKRHDLTWNALAAIVHVLLYFHPLVWLAHRRARQEQEMACDEMVVTHLGAARHDYGQMLVKVVRRLGRNFPTDMAVVGMASSYHTLSQRIEAMKFIRPITRRQIALAACGLALLAVLTIIPWQVVAQDAKPTTRPPAQSGVESQTDTPVAKAEPTATAKKSETTSSPSPTLPQNFHSGSPLHSRNLWRVKFSSDGKLLAGGGVDGMLHVWNANNGTARFTIQAHDTRIGVLGFSPDGQVVETAEKLAVKKWNALTGELLSTTKLDLQGSAGAGVLAMSSDGNLLAGNLSNGSNIPPTLVIWDSTSGHVAANIDIAGIALAAAFSPDSKLLAVGTIGLANPESKGSLQIYDVASATRLRTIDAHPNSISSVAFSPDGLQIAGGDHRAVRLWNVANGELQKRLEGHSGVVESIAFSTDGKMLASGAEGPVFSTPNECYGLSEAKVWDLSTDRLVKSVAGKLGRTTGIAFSPDGKRLARCDFRSLVCEDIGGGESWVKYFEPDSQ